MVCNTVVQQTGTQTGANLQASTSLHAILYNKNTAITVHTRPSTLSFAFMRYAGFMNYKYRCGSNQHTYVPSACIHSLTHSPDARLADLCSLLYQCFVRTHQLCTRAFLYTEGRKFLPTIRNIYQNNGVTCQMTITS